MTLLLMLPVAANVTPCFECQLPLARERREVVSVGRDCSALGAVEHTVAPNWVIWLAGMMLLG